MKIEERKRDHIRICLEEEVESNKNYFEDILLIHKSLPEIDLEKISTKTKFLGKALNLPLIISGMTGGTRESREINKSLAEIAEKKGIGFAVGSQRAMIEDKSKKETYYVRDVAPNALLLGNIGIVQVKELKVEQIRNALDEIEADALCVHLNPAQEIFQAEGETDFSDCLPALKNLCDELDYPVIAKEVGNGISRETAELLKKSGVKAIDVGGFGGTNWIVVDALRSGKDFKSFKDWGIPTPISILEAKVGLPLIATGGIRSGIDIAKSIVLGADLCGIALPFLRKLKKEGKKGVEEYVNELERDLKRAMFLTGSKNLSELKKAEYVLTGRVKDWAEQRKLI